MSTAEELAAAGRTAEAMEAWLANSVFVPARERPGVAGRLHKIVSDYRWWRAEHPGLRSGLEPPAAGRLDEISAPTLVIVGERDVLRVQAASNVLAAGIRGARLVVQPGVGHMSNSDTLSVAETPLDTQLGRAESSSGVADRTKVESRPPGGGTPFE